MASGQYLYGFTDGAYRLEGECRGLADAPLRKISFADVAAIVSEHPVEKLALLRRHLEPHHRAVREMSRQTTFLPATFGHISEGEAEIVALLEANRPAIRCELDRLAGRAEMGLKLMWDVDNIFEFFVNLDRGLRQCRDRVFGKSRASMQEKLELGAFFEKRLQQERERRTAQILAALRPVYVEVRENPVTDEKMVLHAAFLIERARESEFEQAVYQAASLFDSHFAVDYSGPWPPYSFVRLQLLFPAPAAA
jgi:hypothetical protein